MDRQELGTLVGLLQKCEPGVLDERVFIELARIMVLPAIEFIPLRRHAGRIEVLLLPRPDTDPVWPGMLHTPGTILRPTDESMETAFVRLRNDELGGVLFDEPRYIGTQFIHGDRGAAVTIEHIIEVGDNPPSGLYYAIDDLPATFIQLQRPMVQRAAACFEAM